MRPVVRGVAWAVASAGLVAGCAGGAQEPDTDTATGGTKKSPYASIQLEKVLGKPGLCWSSGSDEGHVAPLELAPCARPGRPNQTFTLTRVETGAGGRNWYQIRDDGTGQCLRVLDGRPGARVVQGRCAESEEGQWSIRDSRFSNRGSGLVITAADEKPGSALTTAKLSTGAGEDQKFDIRGL
ncbi:RICIN domain-containing protein [Streptomyces huasconensis]|uniref:RICIN domain-containing protein n=1 Tax=Streptomyces huasconensis TaxID=1854574 RepID=A0ABV3LTI7_9ACTN